MSDNDVVEEQEEETTESELIVEGSHPAPGEVIITSLRVVSAFTAHVVLGQPVPPGSRNGQMSNEYWDKAECELVAQCNMPNGEAVQEALQAMHAQVRKSNQAAVGLMAARVKEKLIDLTTGRFVLNDKGQHILAVHERLVPIKVTETGEVELVTYPAVDATDPTAPKLIQPPVSKSASGNSPAGESNDTAEPSEPNAEPAGGDDEGYGDDF